MSHCSDYFAIYDRHRGPFTLILSREETKKVKGEDTVVLKKDRERGPFSAEDAHETARMLVSDPRDNVRDVFVYSESECQFIGAAYYKGQVIPAWDAQRGARLAAMVPAEATAPAAPVVDMLAAVEKGLRPYATPAAPKPERREPKPEQRTPTRRGAPLVLGKADGWPASKGAQIVLQFFTQPNRQATTQEIVGAIGPQLQAAGIEFPGSLVSRLKQAGFLTEAA